MKSKSLRVIAVCLTAGSGVWCWLLLNMQPDSVSGRRGKLAISSPRKMQNAPAPVVWPERGSREFKHLALVRTRSWLDASGRDAAGLIAVWDLTHDESLAAEAAERFPDDPLVCVAMIGNVSSEAAKTVLPWIERLLAAEPQNSHGYFLKAWALAHWRYPDREGVFAALTQAVTVRGSREAHGRVRADAVREAALAAGMSAADAARLSIGDPLDRLGSCNVGNSLNNFMRNEIERVKKAGDDAQLLEVTGLCLAVAKAWCGNAPINLTQARNFLGLEQSLLEDLPDDTVIGAGGRTAGAARAEYLARRKYIMDASGNISPAADRLKKASEEIAVSYANRLLDSSEHEAILWIMAQPRSAWAVPVWSP